MILTRFGLFLAILVSFGKINAQTTNQINNFNKIWPIICKIESDCNPKAYNKSENAIGISQIRLNYFKDSTNFAKIKGLRHSDCFNPEISKKITINYFLRYNSRALENGDLESLSKLHNGGPSWQKNAKKNGQTAKNLATYWGKVNRELKKD